MPIKGDTALSSFSGKELAESSAIHGDFNQASINYSGHQNLEVRGAEFIKWFEEAEGPDCFICGTPNPKGDFEGHDNICEPCQSKWTYDDGDEGEGYYKSFNAEPFGAEGYGPYAGNYRAHVIEYLLGETSEDEIMEVFDISQEDLDSYWDAESFGAEPFGVKCNDPHNKGCGKRDYATRLFNICHNCQEEMRAESFGAEYGKRQRFGNRYVARDTKGKFISNVSVGRSLKADRRNKSKTPARSGFGHRGDARKGASGEFKLPTDAKSLVGIGAVLGGLWAYLESKA